MQLAATIQNETLNDLVTRVYAFDSGPSAKVTRAARQALLDANPYLADLKQVPPGTVFTVPDVQGAQPSAATEDAGPMIGTIAVQQLRGAVALTAQQLQTDLDAEIADARNAAALTKPAALKGAGVAAGADQKQLLAQVAQAAGARVERAQALQKYQKLAFGQIEKDLVALVSAFGGGSPG